MSRLFLTGYHKHHLVIRWSMLTYYDDGDNNYNHADDNNCDDSDNYYSNADNNNTVENDDGGMRDNRH